MDRKQHKHWQKAVRILQLTENLQNYISIMFFSIWLVTDASGFIFRNS